MKVLALASYPIEAAGTRYRVAQFVEPLRKHGIELAVYPFMNSATFGQLYNRAKLPQTSVALTIAALRRLSSIFAAGKYDALFVQREAMLFGPPVIEWLATKWKKLPLILDLDDATYVSYQSPVYGKLASALKFFGKTDKLIKWSSAVLCGNPAIAEYVTSQGKRAEIVPTVVDTNVFCPRQNQAEPARRLIIGWIGTHSTFPFLRQIFPVLDELSKDHDFELKVVGAGSQEIELENVRVNNLPWKLEREVADFQSLDIGLYPIFAEQLPPGLAAGKSGFKAIQYMSVGVPYVVSPVGVCATIGIAGKTHFCATTHAEWHNSLAHLLTNKALRLEMGKEGRLHALQHYTVPQQANKIAKVLFECVC